MSSPPHPHIIVAAAVVERDGRFLLTCRLAGTHLEGLWEFPGGKCEDGESPEACLVREMREELNAAVIVGEAMLVTRHAYPAKSVELHFFTTVVVGEPTPQLGQELKWASRSELHALAFPEADADLIRLLSGA